MLLWFQENYINSEDNLADTLHLWESWAKSSGAKDLKFIFKAGLKIHKDAHLNEYFKI